MVEVLIMNLTARYGSDAANVIMTEIEKVSKPKNGDSVKIAETSKYYVDDDNYNPKDESGVVVEVNGVEIYVKWKNGNTNVYKELDF